MSAEANTTNVSTVHSEGCLCQSPWSEHLLSYGVLCAHRPLGSVCPICLHHPPIAAAAWIREYGQRLTTTVGELAIESNRRIDFPTSASQYREQILATIGLTEQLRETSAFMKSAAPMLRESSRRRGSR